MTLRVEDLVAGYGARAVVDGVSFDVGPGELVTVLGASGSGKTTLLRAIAGLHRVDGGRVLLDERDVTGLPAERRRVGLVPQEGALFPHRTVAANIGYGVARKERPDRVRAMLELIGLGDRAHARPYELSGGQRQRVALARALAPAPPVLLLDEPFSSLDAELRVSLRMDISRIVVDTATAAVLVTHDVIEALTMSDRIVVLENGKVMAVGSPYELYRCPPSKAVAEKLGPATILAARPAGPARVSTALGTLGLLEGQVTDVDAGSADGPDGARVLVRPEQLRLTAAGAAEAGGRGRVLWSEYRGATRIVHVELSHGQTVAVRTPPTSRWRVDDAVQIEVTEPVHLLPG